VTAKDDGMTSHADKAAALAEKITRRAEEILASTEYEMTIMKWRPEFRAIMWGAIADIANKRRFEAEAEKTA
jgi:hypothetical protein